MLLGDGPPGICTGARAPGQGIGLGRWDWLAVPVGAEAAVPDVRDDADDPPNPPSGNALIPSVGLGLRARTSLRLRASGRLRGRRGRGGGPAGSGRRSAPSRPGVPSPAHGDRAWRRRSRMAARRTAQPSPGSSPASSSPASNECGTGLPRSQWANGRLHRPGQRDGMCGQRRPATQGKTLRLWRFTRCSPPVNVPSVAKTSGTRLQECRSGLRRRETLLPKSATTAKPRKAHPRDSTTTPKPLYEVYQGEASIQPRLSGYVLAASAFVVALLQRKVWPDVAYLYGPGGRVEGEVNPHAAELGVPFEQPWCAVMRSEHPSSA